VPGFDTAQSIANLALRVMPFSPDIVIIYHGYNDLKVIRPGVELLPDYTHVHNRPYGLHERQPWFLRAANKSMAFVRAQNSYRTLRQDRAGAESFDDANRFDAVPPEAARQFEHNMRMLIGSARAGVANVILSSVATLHDIDTLLAGGEPPAGDMAVQELVAMTIFTPGLSLRGILSGVRQYNQIVENLARAEHTGWVDNAALVPHSDENFLDRIHVSARGARRIAGNMLPEVLRLLPATPH
jgi:lysophospholipase L1-like esterase